MVIASAGTRRVVRWSVIRSFTAYAATPIRSTRRGASAGCHASRLSESTGSIDQDRTASLGRSTTIRCTAAARGMHRRANRGTTRTTGSRTAWSRARLLCASEPMVAELKSRAHRQSLRGAQARRPHGDHRRGGDIQEPGLEVRDGRRQRTPRPSRARSASQAGWAIATIRWSRPSRRAAASAATVAGSPPSSNAARSALRSHAAR